MLHPLEFPFWVVSIFASVMWFVLGVLSQHPGRDEEEAGTRMGCFALLVTITTMLTLLVLLNGALRMPTP